MKKHGFRLVLAAAIASLALPAFAADELEILSLNPPGGALSGIVGGASIGPGNSVEVTFRYRLDSASDGKIGIFTAAVTGNPPTHTGVEVPIWVKKGKGEVKTRFSVQCAGSDVLIVNVRYCLFKQAPGGPLEATLLEKFKDVKFEFRCKPATHPGGANKPDIGFLRKGVYLWGSDPTKKHWVDWGTSVNLTAVESISPKVGNGPCRFNVEYYPKELNGVAAGPFKNGIHIDVGVLSDGPMTLAANAFADRTLVLPLSPGGPHGLDVSLDQPGAVAETDEGNNNGAIRYTLEGSCTGTPGPAGKP